MSDTPTIPDGWQPIETAPHDREIHILSGNGNIYYEAICMDDATTWYYFRSPPGPEDDEIAPVPQPLAWKLSEPWIDRMCEDGILR
jgi:hypothetical protein